MFGVRPDRRIGVDDLRPRSEPDALEGAERHQQRLAAAKADRFARHPATVPADQPAVVADRERCPADPSTSTSMTDDLGDGPVKRAIGKPLDLVDDVAGKAQQASLPKSPWKIRPAPAVPGTLADAPLKWSKGRTGPDIHDAYYVRR